MKTKESELNKIIDLLQDQSERGLGNIVLERNKILKLINNLNADIKLLKNEDKIFNELMIKSLQDSLDVRTRERDELRHELELLKARIDGGVRVWARLSPNYVRADDIRTYKTCVSKSNSTLILDDGVEL